MAYQKHYQEKDWQNLPSQKTPINRTNLMHIERGINENDNRIVALDAKKFDVSQANLLVKSVTVDPATGVIAVTLLNGTVTTYDLDIEKVVVNFDITDDNILVITLADGTTKEVDLTKFVYTFSNTATISLKQENRVVTAEIIDGSVTMEKLDAAIQSEFLQYKLDAETAANSALQYQKFSRRYAIGYPEEFPGSESDNAKYYYEQSKTNAETSTQNAQSALASKESAESQAAIATQKATLATASANSASADAATASQKAQDAEQSKQTAVQSAQEALTSKTIAEQKAEYSEEYADLSKRYAVGGVIPEDANDNSKWYYQQCQDIKNQMDAVASLVVPNFFIDFDTGKLMSDKEGTGIHFWLEDGKLYGEVTA